MEFEGTLFRGWKNSWKLSLFVRSHEKVKEITISRPGKSEVIEKSWDSEKEIDMNFYSKGGQRHYID